MGGAYSIAGTNPTLGNESLSGLASNIQNQNDSIARRNKLLQSGGEFGGQMMGTYLAGDK